MLTRRRAPSGPPMEPGRSRTARSRPTARVARFLVGLTVSVAVFAGISAIGVLTSMDQTFPAPPPAPLLTDIPDRPVVRAAAGDRHTVAVVLGATGSVAADALIPYEVFGRAREFSVYTVAQTRDPVTLSGALHVLPDRTFEEISEPPDVVVVPAVADPTGDREAPLRAWVAKQERAGSHILAVCAGSDVLAASGVLDGRRATSHWARLGPLRRSYPKVEWVGEVRYVDAGAVITTGGITSGAAGALRVLERVAGADEALRVGRDLRYPGWSPGGATRIPERRHDVVDVPYWLNAAFPWSRPTIALALQDGVGEVEVAAAGEVYSGGSFATRTLTVSENGLVTTRHGLILLTHPADRPIAGVDRVVAVGADTRGDVEPDVAAWAATRGIPIDLPEAASRHRFPFDGYLRDLARVADRATTLATAKYLEYPASHLRLEGRAWPWRPTILLVAAMLVSLGIGWAAATVARFLTARRRARTGPGDPATGAAPCPIRWAMTNRIEAPGTGAAAPVSPGTAGPTPTTRGWSHG